MNHEQENAVLKEVLTEVYQVLGCIAFGDDEYTDDDVERVMDNVSAAIRGDKIPHDDLLPWPKEI